MTEAELFRRADELFRRAVDLPEDEREALLRGAEETDPPAATRARRMIELDRESAVASEDSDPAGLLGRALGPYEIVELVGTGGMGAVYRARRRDPDETVAIKFLPAYGASADLIERFQRETELVASFHHPGIVGFRHSGKSADGSLYLAMEFIEGAPLSPALPAVHESVAKTVDFVIGAAAAVQYMHGRATLHRDLTPSNILVRTDGDRPAPVLIDLGIARRLNPDADWASQTLGPVGTPLYMSPEQLDARPDVDVTTDVFGLGAVLYELLAGVPARGLGELRAFDRDLIERRLAEPASPPSEVVDAERFGRENASRRARELRGDLDAIVVRALESDPADRYPSVEAFSADLYRWLDRRPVVARPIGAWGRTWRLARRNPGAALAIAAAVLVLVATSIVTSLSLRSERRALAALSEQVETTDRIRRFVTEDVFERAAPENEGPETPVIEIVRGVASELGSGLDESPAVAVGLRGSLLAVLARMGDHAAATEQADAGWPLARSLPEDHPQRLEFELEAARLLEYRNLHAEAERALRELIPRLERARGPVADLRADALGDLGVSLLGQNRLSEARDRLHEALALMPAPDARRYPVLANLTLVESDLNGPASALEPMLALQEEIDAHFGPDHVWAMGIASNLSSTYLHLDQPERALPHARRAMALADATYAPDHADRLTVMNNLAACLVQNQEYDEAIPLRREVLELRTALFGERNVAVVVAAMNLATTLKTAGHAAEALEPAERAVALSLEVSGPAHPKSAQAYHALAAVLDGLGEKEPALEAYDAAIDIYTRAEGDHTAALDLVRTQRGVAAARR